MKIATRVAGVLAVLTVFATAVAYADLARPEPRKPITKYIVSTGMEVVPDAKSYSARLQISQATLKEISEAMNETTSSSSGRTFNVAMRTIIAGVFLFLSVSFAGVWLARNNGTIRTPKAAALVLIGGGLIGAAAIIAHANAGPPPSYYWRNLPKNLNDGKATNAAVEIEIVPDGHGIKLIVPMRKPSGYGD